MNSIVRKVFEAHLHIAGDKGLPRLTEQVLSELITQNGVLTQNNLLTVFIRGLLVDEDTEERRFIADLRLPAKIAKLPKLKDKAASFTADGLRWDPEAKKRVWPKGNTYRIVGASEETRSLTIRLAERWQAKREESAEVSEWTEVTSANFMQAVLKTYADLPFLDEAPEILWEPVTKQACEQLLSYIRNRLKGEQEATVPSTANRRPDERLEEWRHSIDVVGANTVGFAYKAPEQQNGGNRRKRVRNISPDWIAFATSPVPGRLAIKIAPEHFALYRRKWQGDGRSPVRTYLALRVFAGIREDTALGRLRGAENRKLFWWHNHLAEFRPLPPWKEKSLAANDEMIVVPLDHSCDGRFEAGFEDGRKVCLLTLSEHRLSSAGMQAKSYSGSRHHSTERLKTSNLVYTAGFATSAEVAHAELPRLVLGLHFSDEPVVAWALADASGTIVQTGRIEGNAPLEAGLFQKMRLEAHQKKLHWVGGREFRGVIRERTLELARRIIFLALRFEAALALEEIQWVDKRRGSAVENRRFSMWNYSELSKRIEWLGLDIATREICGDMKRFTGRTVRVIDRPWDYFTAFTCPCGACRKAKQEAGHEDTILVARVLTCRKCGYSGVVPHEEKAKIVARHGAHRLRKLMEKAAGESGF